MSLSTRLFFSASAVLGSRPGSVGVGVAGCPGAAWVFNRRAPRAAWSLALCVPLAPGVSPAVAAAHAKRAVCGSWPGVFVRVRIHRGRPFLRVFGPVATLRAVAAWWSGPPPASSAAALPLAA